MSLVRSALFLLLLAFALSFPTPASLAGEALVGSEAEVDVTGKDAGDAKARALAKGEVDALIDLLNKLARPEQAKSILANLSAAQIAGMVRGTEVLEEKISDNRYRARLLINFDGDAISGLISKTGAAGGEEPGVGSYLIVPVYEEDGQRMLWEPSNPWRGVWKQLGLETGTGDLVVPYGDTMDAGLLDAGSAEAATFSALTPLTIRYGVSDIVILQARLTRLPDMELTVVKRRMNRTQNEVNLYTFRADPQETKETLLLRAGHEMADILLHRKLEESQTSKSARGGEKNRVMALASVTTIASWTQLRAKLTTLPMVDRLEILAISPRQVDMVIHYRGPAEALADGIASLSIRLVKNPSYWILSRD